MVRVIFHSRMTRLGRATANMYIRLIINVKKHSSSLTINLQCIQTKGNLAMPTYSASVILANKHSVHDLMQIQLAHKLGRWVSTHTWISYQCRVCVQQQVCDLSGKVINTSNERIAAGLVLHIHHSQARSRESSTTPYWSSSVRERCTLRVLFQRIFLPRHRAECIDSWFSALLAGKLPRGLGWCMVISVSAGDCRQLPGDVSDGLIATFAPGPHGGQWPT
jgi:hypothetical protein